MNASDNLSSIRRHTVGQTFLQAGMFLELAEQGAKLTGLLEAAKHQANAAERQNITMVQQRAHKEMAVVWRKSVCHIADMSRNVVQTLPENGFKVLSFVILRRFAERTELLSSSSEIGLQEMLAAKEVLAKMATAEKEFMAKLGASGTAEEYLEQKLSDVLPMVRETAVAFQRYDAEMGKIRERLTGALTVADFQTLVEVEAKVSATMNAALDNWVQWYPQHDDIAALGVWQQRQAEGKYLQSRPHIATRPNMEYFEIHREEYIDSLEDIEALTERISEPDECEERDRIITTEIKRLQELVDNRPTIRSEYLHALLVGDTRTVQSTQERLGAFALFTDDQQIIELEIVQKDKARVAEEKARVTEVRTQKFQKVGACLQRFVSVAEKEIHAQRQDRPQWSEISLHRVGVALDNLADAGTILSEEKGSFGAIDAAVKGARATWDTLLVYVKRPNFILKRLALTAGVVFAVLLPVTELLAVKYHEPNGDTLADELLGTAVVDAVVSMLVSTITPVGWAVVWVSRYRRRRVVFKAHVAFKEAVERLREVANDPEIVALQPSAEAEATERVIKSALDQVASLNEDCLKRANGGEDIKSKEDLFK